MPEYSILQAKGHQFGLNQKSRPDELVPGEAVTAQNVEFDNGTIRKIKGSSNVCTGEVDSVFKGGPPASSLYVQGDPWWLEHPEAEAVKSERSGLLQDTTSKNWFRSPFHARQGVIMIPDGGQEVPLALSPKKTSGTNWAMETMLWSDDIRFQQQDNTDTTEPFLPVVVMAKEWSGTGGRQWRLLIRPVDTSATSGDLGFYLTLELYDPTAAASSYFYYDAGSGPASFFYPGERVWIAFSFDKDAGSNGEITSYYRREGGSTVSSTQSVGATISGNGTVAASNSGCSIMVGGGFAGFGAQRNFNGVVGELRFYNAGVGNASLHPTWDGDYSFYESEFPDSELVTSGSTTVEDTDLDLYWSFSHDRIISGRFVLPRFSRSSVALNGAWLTGADAAWATSSDSKMGTQALAFMPSGPTGTGETFYRSLVYQLVSGSSPNGSPSDMGPELFGGGLRVPNGDQYLQPKQDSTSGLDWLDAYSVAGAFSTYDIETGFLNERILWQHNYVPKGGSSDEHAYKVVGGYEVSIEHDGSNWVLRAYVRTGASGTEQVLNSSGGTALAANTAYSFAFAVTQDSGNTVAHLYLNGVEEDRINVSQAKGGKSVATDSDDANDNTNVADGRDKCYPIAIGCGFNLEYSPSRNDRAFMFGAEATVGSESGGTSSLPTRRWWAFHRDFTQNSDCKKTPNAGVGYRGYLAHRGLIGWIGVWKKKLTESEVVAIASNPPTDQQIRGFGPDLLSLWLFQEGQGNILYDAGTLRNHIPIQAEPQVRPVVGPFARSSKSNLLQLTEFRSRTAREGVGRREVYGLSEGSIVRLVSDSSGDKTWTPISSHQFVNENSLGSTFQYSDFVYWCPGEGPVLRISRNKVSSAGIAAPFSSQQNDFKGWQEGDRDGTFQIVPGSAGSNFASGSTYIYAITFYDPESGTESPPSRLCHWKAATGLESLTLRPLPCSHDKHVTKYRIYRSSADGGDLQFLDEIPVKHSYTDDRSDLELGKSLDSWQNYPPPQNASIGVQFGSRALYAGVPTAPATLYVSKTGFPEACPIEYQQTLTAGRSSEITGIHVMHGRALVFMQDAVFQVSDSGGDIGPESLGVSPIGLEQISDETGCVAHHSLKWIDGVGLVFAGERGIYVTQDGFSFTYLSERAEPFWESLDKTSWRKWHAVHWRKRHKYILFCSTGDVSGRNETALVWDYMRNAFTTMSGVEARHSLVVEDETTGENRLYASDYLGQLWELDTTADSFGGPTTASGTVQSGSSATEVVLVADSSLRVTGDGLRGVELLVNGERKRIASNTANNVTLESALNAIPATNDPWKLGSIQAKYKTGRMDFGDQTRLKQVQFVEMDTYGHAGSTTDVTVTTDDDGDQVFSSQDMAGRQVRVGPVYGRFRKMDIEVEDDSPDNQWEVEDFNVAWFPRGRSKW